MFRWLAVCLVLCAATVALMSLALGERGSLYPWVEGKANGTEGDPRKEAVYVASQPKLAFASKERESADQKLVVYDGHIHPIDKQDVPSEREGRVLLVGTNWSGPLPVGEELDRQVREGRLIQEPLYYLATQVDPNRTPGINFRDLITSRDKPDQLFQVLKNTNVALQPGRLVVAPVAFNFKKLEVGDKVKKGDLVALINPEIAFHDLTNKVNNYAKAEADRLASEKTRDEAYNRLERSDKARRNGIKGVSDDDFFQAKLTYEKYVYEERAKGEALAQARSELDAAYEVVRMHEVRAQISGRIKTIYKNRGDGLKSMEPVLQIQNEDQLRVDGTIGVAETQHLVLGMEASIEPTHPEGPWRNLSGHTREITCVAVSNGPKSRIVSGSEDRSLRVWDPVTSRESYSMIHPRTAPRSLACSTGPKSKMNLALVGWADGTAQVFNLDALEDPENITNLSEQAHQSAVNSVAFSPDGTVALTGGEDRSIKVWKVSLEGKKPVVRLLWALKAVHKSPITCVQSISVDDTKGSQVVEFYSVSDNVVQVWRMENEGPPTREQEFDHRKGDVAVLGNDGNRILFDENGELRLHSLADRAKVEGRLRNPPGTSPFTNMALFAPNGKTILTNVAADGRLQLWRTPPPQGRGSELRQFVRPIGNAASGNVCAAFAPDSSFVVTGQGVDLHIWKMPNAQEIDSRLTARLVRVERALENSSQLVPIWAELDKHHDWISAGGHATMVIDLNQKVPALVPGK